MLDVSPQDSSKSVRQALCLSFPPSVLTISLIFVKHFENFSQKMPENGKVLFVRDGGKTLAFRFLRGEKWICGHFCCDKQRYLFCINEVRESSIFRKMPTGLCGDLENTFSMAHPWPVYWFGSTTPAVLSCTLRESPPHEWKRLPRSYPPKGRINNKRTIVTLLSTYMTCHVVKPL